MSSVQDHVDAALALLAGPEVPPLADTLTVYDGKVGVNPPPKYALVYAFRLRPDGLTAPDRIPLTGASVAVDMRLYIHCVGTTASSARAVQGRVEALLLDVTPVVPGRTCGPIRLLDGQQADRNEATLTSVFDNVDVYGWLSQPG